MIQKSSRNKLSSYVVLVWILFSVVCGTARAQNSFPILNNDTTINAGGQVVLAIDTGKLFSNFIFSARNPATNKWTIWAKQKNGKYGSVFNDRYNRGHVKVLSGRGLMAYVKYKTQSRGSMKNESLDSAWVCLSALNGSNELTLFAVPDFRKNAVYDLDVSADGTKILYAVGNDRFPDFTRDGDVFEYDVNTKSHTNLTNNWTLWSKYCKWSPDAKTFAFSHYTNFWYSNPTNIFIGTQGQPARQLTHNLGYSGADQFCTLTDFLESSVLYRRGDFSKNRLYQKRIGGDEALISGLTGLGGIYLGNDVYAFTDTLNAIVVSKNGHTLRRFTINEIESFCADEEYNFGRGISADLNWLGMLPVKIIWSNGATSSTINVAPNASEVFTAQVDFNGVRYTDSIRITVKEPVGVISRRCMMLAAPKGKNFRWLKDGEIIKNASDSIFTPVLAGKYKVQVNAGLPTAFETPEVEITELYLDSLKASSGNIPITADLEHNRILLQTNAVVFYKIVDNNGEVALSGTKNREIGLSELGSGTYTLFMSDKNCGLQAVHKVVIMR